MRAQTLLKIICLTIGFVGATSNLRAWIEPTASECTMTAPEWCPEADAMALDRSAHYTLELTSNGWLLTCNWSVRVKVFTEEGKANGDYRIVEPFQAKIKEVNARTITSGGEILKVKATDIFAKRVYIGEEREHRVNVREFAFPAVTPGAILEVNWTTYSESVVFIDPYFFDEENMPTCSSSFSFTYPTGVRYVLSQLNGTQFGYTSTRTEQVSSRGPLWTYTATCSHINVDLTKRYSPGDGYERPHLWMVFTNYSANGYDIDIVPDWAAAAKDVAKRYARFTDGSRRIKPLYQRLTNDEPDTLARVERLFRWVADSLEFIDSRYPWDWDGRLDDKLKAGQATGVEKILILQQLLRLAGQTAAVALVVPLTESPGVAKVPALTQFRDVLLRWDYDSSVVYLDPVRKGTPIGLVPWTLENALCLPLLDDIEGVDHVSCDRAKNIMLQDVYCELDGDGNVEGKSLVTLADHHAIRHRHGFATTDTSEHKEYVAKWFGGQLTKGDIQTYSVREDSANRARLYVEFSFRHDRLADRVGADLVLKPNFIDPIKTDLIPFDDRRVTDLHFPHTQTTLINLHFKLPAGMIAADTAWSAAASDPGKLSYQASISPEPGAAGTLLYQRRYKREVRVIPVAEYGKVRDLFNKMAEHDAAQIVLRGSDQFLQR